MSAYRNRNSGSGPTRNFTTPRSISTTNSTSTSRSKAVPKKFTASSPRNASANSQEIKTFTNRCVNRKNYRVAAPPKFLQRSTGTKPAQVKPSQENKQDTTMTAKTTTTSSSLRRHSRPELKHTSLFHKVDTDPATTASESDEQPEDTLPEQQKKEKPKIRRHDPLMYRSTNCTFNQDYLSMLTFDPKLEEPLTFSDEEEEKSEAKAVPRARTFKPYVKKKEQSSGFGFFSSGLEDSLLSGSGFSYKPTVAKKPLPKRTIKTEGEKKNVLPPTIASTNAFSSSPMFF